MIGVLGHDSALQGYTGPGKNLVNEMNCYESCPWCRIDLSSYKNIDIGQMCINSQVDLSAIEYYSTSA